MAEQAGAAAPFRSRSPGSDSLRYGSAVPQQNGAGGLGLRLAFLFTNVGSYHAARLRAADAACSARGWEMTAIQETDDTLEHPWGDLEAEITFRLLTLLPRSARDQAIERGRLRRMIRTRVAAVLTAENPDVVFVAGWSTPAAIAALMWCRRTGAAAVVMSESKSDDSRRRWWVEKIKTLVVRRFDAALVGGQLHRDYVVSLGVPQDRVFMGYNAVDNAHFGTAADRAREDPTRARLRQPQIPGRPYFLVVTRFMPRKNLARLITAYARYRESVGPDAWDLVLCGDGEDEPMLRRTTAELELGGSVHFPGFLPYSALGDWYGLASALIHPALQEPWGLVVNEACAAGLPVLCSRTVGAARELVQQGHNGWVFDPESAAEIAESMTALHRLQPDARERMGAASRQVVSRFAPEQFGKGVVEAVLAAEQHRRR